MAQRHWVGGNATWDATAGTKWSTTAGGASGAAVPTAADDVFLDASSGANTVTLGAGLTAVCRSLDCTGFTGTFAWGTGTLNIGDASGGAFKMVSGMTVSGTATGAVQFVSSSTNGGTGWGITTGGKLMPNANFTPNAGKWVLQDAWSSSLQSITVSNGSFFGNGQSISCASFSSANGNVRTVDLTNCSVTVTGTSASWQFGVVTNLTFVGTGATVTQSGAGAVFNTGNFNYGGLSAVMNGSGGTSASVGGGTATVLNFTRTGTASKLDAMTMSGGLVVTGTLTLGGNTTQGVNRIIVQSSVVGTQRTINCTGAAVVINGDVDFIDITISGSPSWTNTGSAFVGDGGGNGSLITTNRTTPATQTSTGTASFTWSTHGWTSRVPLPQDTVLIPNAFVAGRTITADMPRLGGAIDFSGCTGSPTFSTTVTTSIFGSLTLVSGVAPGGAVTVTLAGRSICTITTAGATWTQAFIVGAPTGTYTLQDAFSASRSVAGVLQVTAGTFVDAGMTVTLSGAAATFTMTGGTLTKTGAWSFSTTSAVSFWSVTGGTVTDSGSSTLAAVSANTRTFAGGGSTYGTLTYTVAGSTGQLTISGSNTFSTINFSDVTNARTLAFTAGATTTITNAFNVNGTSGKLMTVTTASATTHSLVKSNGAVAVNYVSVSNSLASGTSFFAGTHSTDGGGNTGWTFTDPVLTGSLVSTTVIANTGTPAATVAGALSSEADAANLGTPIARTVGTLATEADSANLGTPRAVVVGAQPSETDTANAGVLRAVVAGLLGQETDSTFVGTVAALVAGARATETDAANAGVLAFVTVGALGTEIDTGMTGSPLAATVGLRASESDSPNVGIALVVVVGTQSNETDVGLHVSVVIYSGTQAFEADTATAGALLLAVIGALSSETDLANSGTITAATIGQRATEVDLPINGTVAAVLAGIRATESDSSAAGILGIAGTGTRATESATAATGTPTAAVQGLEGVESTTSAAGTLQAAMPGQQAATTNAPNSGTFTERITGSSAGDTSSSPLGALTRVVLPGGRVTTVETVSAGELAFRTQGIFATEADSGFTGVALGGIAPIGVRMAIGVHDRTMAITVADRALTVAVTERPTDISAAEGAFVE